jgi:hypothetical protein
MSISRTTTREIECMRKKGSSRRHARDAAVDCSLTSRGQFGPDRPGVRAADRACAVRGLEILMWPPLERHTRRSIELVRRDAFAIGDCLFLAVKRFLIVRPHADPFFQALADHSISPDVPPTLGALTRVFNPCDVVHAFTIHRPRQKGRPAPLVIARAMTRKLEVLMTD